MPIFIVGFARSGTTLAQKLVSQHLGIPTLPETHFFELLDNHEPAGGQLKAAAARALVEEMDGLIKVDAQALRGLLDRDEVPIRALFLQVIGQQIGSQALADKGQWLEKTPGHAAYMERIHQMFPKARFLCMVRNPLLVFASQRELLEPGKGWGDEWKPVEVYCAQWAQHVRALREFGERHPGQLLVLRLEDLAADPEAQLARVRDFVGPGFANPTTAPLEPGIVQPFETWKRDALKPADPAIADRAGKGLLDPYETWRVRTLLAEEMALLGYAAEAEGADAPGALDDLHRKLIASVDWYRAQFARRDQLMDVKTTRIRGLLNELAQHRQAAPADGAGASPGATGGLPAPRAKGRPAGKVAAKTAAKATAKGALAPVPPGPAAKAKGAADEDDSYPAVHRPFTLRGISGVNDNGAEFAARAARRKPADKPDAD